ncbi:MAG: hypothetical protein JF603_06995 [Acidobacteria bacterium]|nr:hypothetical protein [Acidobacteriota bacterium]
MLLESLDLTPEELRRSTGWEIKPEGACKDDRCVPLPGVETRADGTIDVRAFADRMGMPVAGDETHGLWALGPQAGASVLQSAQVSEIVLPDFAGNAFDVASLRGRKVLLLAWASW